MPIISNIIRTFLCGNLHISAAKNGKFYGKVSRAIVTDYRLLTARPNASSTASKFTCV